MKLPRLSTHHGARGSQREGPELKVAVLGAGGTIAPAIVRDLAESDEVSAMLLLDIDESRAATVAERHGKGKARAVRADARAAPGEPGSVARAIDRCDVLVNAASYRVNLDAMRACLATETHYLDLGGLYWMTGRQLQLGPEFERAGLLGLLGIGSAPGKTNLMAARAAAELGRNPAASASGQGRVTDRPSGSIADDAVGIDSIDVSAAGRDLHPPPGFSVPYALQTLVDELTMRPVVLRGGEPVEIEPLSDAGRVDFGPPIGTAETIHALHSELRTFPATFPCRECSFSLSLDRKLLDRLRELSSASRERIARAAAHVEPPSPKTVAVHLVQASGHGKRVRVRCVTEPVSRWKLGGGVVSTAAPAAAAVRLLARGRVDARGVLPPETALPHVEMFAELEAREARIEVEVSTVGEGVPA